MKTLASLSQGWTHTSLTHTPLPHSASLPLIIDHVTPPKPLPPPPFFSQDPHPSPPAVSFEVWIL